MKVWHIQTRLLFTECDRNRFRVSCLFRTGCCNTRHKALVLRFGCRLEFFWWSSFGLLSFDSESDFDENNSFFPSNADWVSALGSHSRGSPMTRGHNRYGSFSVGSTPVDSRPAINTNTPSVVWVHFGSQCGWHAIVICSYPDLFHSRRWNCDVWLLSWAHKVPNDQSLCVGICRTSHKCPLFRF